MATLLKADHTRRIELDGYGAAPRPVDIDPTRTGFEMLKTLRIYRFDPPGVIHGHAEEDEVLLVVLDGRIDLQMKSRHWSDDDRHFTLEAANGPAGVSCAAYLPPQAEYSLTVLSAATVAYARALPTEHRPPAVFSVASQADREGSRLLLDQATHAQHLRLQVWQVTGGDRAVDWCPAEALPAARETLLHVRSQPADAVTLANVGSPATPLESWDTLALRAGDRPQLRVSAHAAVLGLVVGAV